MSAAYVPASPHHTHLPTRAMGQLPPPRPSRVGLAVATVADAVEVGACDAHAIASATAPTSAVVAAAITPATPATTDTTSPPIPVTALTALPRRERAALAMVPAQPLRRGPSAEIVMTVCAAATAAPVAAATPGVAAVDARAQTDVTRSVAPAQAGGAAAKPADTKAATTAVPTEAVTTTSVTATVNAATTQTTATSTAADAAASSVAAVATTKQQGRAVATVKKAKGPTITTRTAAVVHATLRHTTPVHARGINKRKATLSSIHNSPTHRFKLAAMHGSLPSPAAADLVAVISALRAALRYFRELDLRADTTSVAVFCSNADVVSELQQQIVQAGRGGWLYDNGSGGGGQTGARSSGGGGGGTGDAEAKAVMRVMGHYIAVVRGLQCEFGVVNFCRAMPMRMRNVRRIAEAGRSEGARNDEDRDNEWRGEAHQRGCIGIGSSGGGRENDEEDDSAACNGGGADCRRRQKAPKFAPQLTGLVEARVLGTRARASHDFGGDEEDTAFLIDARFLASLPVVGETCLRNLRDPHPHTCVRGLVNMTALGVLDVEVGVVFNAAAVAAGKGGREERKGGKNSGSGSGSGSVTESGTESESESESESRSVSAASGGGAESASEWESEGGCGSGRLERLEGEGGGGAAAVLRTAWVSAVVVDWLPVEVHIGTGNRFLSEVGDDGSVRVWQVERAVFSPGSVVGHHRDHPYWRRAREVYGIE